MTKSSNKKKKAKIKHETERLRLSFFRIMAPDKIQTDININNENIISKHKTLSSTNTIHVENFAKQTSLHYQSTLNNGTTMTKTQLKCDPIRPIYCRPPLPSKHRFLKKLSVCFRTFCPFFFQFTHRSVLILLILLLTHHHFHHRICLCETVNSLASRHPHLHDHAHHHHHHHHPSNQLPQPHRFEFTSLPSSSPKSYSIQSSSTDKIINKPSTIRPRHSTLLEQHDQFVRLHQNSPLSSYDTPETPTVKHFAVVQRPARPEELSQTRCVERCSCKWRSGKMWVECLDAGLNLVPRGLDSGTQVLHLSGNPLRELEARVFERADLRNLQRLHLSNCRLSEINADAFQQLSNLIELELAQNELTTLPSLALVHCPILRKLSLARNQIKVVKNSAFEKLFHLQSIDLSNNGLEMIESDAFYGLKNLKQLYLHENKLRYIEGQTMQSLPSVYELTLQHNPWWCDCGLRSFRNWMLEHRIPLSYSPNCSTPSRLAGKSWNQLDLDEFACPPDVVSVNTEVVVYEGENASIGCVMAAIPNVRIEWEWRGRTIRNMSLMTFGRQMYLIRESHSPADSGLNNNNDLAVEEVVHNGNNFDDTDGQYFIAEDQLNDMPHLKVFKDQPNSQSLLEQKIVAGNNQLSVLQTLPTMTDTGIDSGISDGRNGEIFLSSLVNSQQLTLPVMSAPQSATINRAKRLSTTTNSKPNDDTYKRTSTLYIMNALEKDSGSYICTGSNKAGTVSANVTLTVLRRLEVTAAAYSGEEVAGIVLGALFVFLLTFVAICFVVLRSKNGLSQRQTTTTVGTGNSTNGQSNGGTTGTADGQTLLTSAAAAANYEKMNGAGPINGRLANGNAHHPLPNGSIVGNGTALRRNSNASTDTKDSKMSTLLVSLNSAAAAPVTTTKSTHLEIVSDQSPSISELALNNQNNMTIRTNRLSEQIEMSNYSSVNSDNDCVDGATINSSYNITIPQRINCYVEDGHHDNDGDNNNNNQNNHNSTELDDDANHRHNMAIINSFYANNSNSPQQQQILQPNRQLTSIANYGTSNSDNCHYAQQQHSQPMPGNNNNHSRITSGTYYPNHHHHHHSNHHHSINDAGFITNGILNGMVNTDNYGANSAMYAAVLNAGQTPNVNNNHNHSQNNPNNSPKCNGESSSSQYSSLSLSSNGTTATAASSSSQSSQSPSAASTRPVTAKLPNYSGQFSNLPQKPYSVVQPIIGGATAMDSAIFLTNNNNPVLSDLYRINNYLPPASNTANSRASPSFSHPHHLLSNPLHHHYSIEDSKIELNKRHAANSVAEELQKRIAMAGTLKRNSSLDSAPSSTGQVVRFANSPTVYNYNSTAVTGGAIVPQAPQLLNKHLNPLNRIRNGGGGGAVGGGNINPIMAAAIALNARDSPDEGLGEESDVLE